MEIDPKARRRARVTRSIALVSAGALLAVGAGSLATSGVTGAGLFAAAAGVVMLVLALRSGREHRATPDA